MLLQPILLKDKKEVSMKKCVYLLLALLPIFLFLGCPESPPGDEDLLSGDALIVSFDFDGITGEAVIDLENRTVTITTIPMDLAGIEPAISISEGAVLGDIPTFEDGVPADILITAEDGTVEEWTVTINVQRGISFLLDGSRVVLTAGMTNFPPPVMSRSRALGAGEPGCCYFGTYIDGFALNEVYDYGIEPPVEEAATIATNGESAGTYNNADCFVHYCLDLEPDGFYEIEINNDTGTSTVILNNSPAVGEDLYGSFSVADAVNLVDDSDVSISSGYFKLLRVDDDSYPDPAYFQGIGGD